MNVRKTAARSSALRALGYTAFRARARVARPGATPPVFLNSYPKAGTHLLLAALERFPGLRSAGIHVDHDGFAAGAPSSRRHGETPDLDWTRVRATLQRVKRGQYMTAHFPAYDELLGILEELDFQVVLVTRDPRDIVVSTAMYVKGLRRHPMYRPFTETYKTDRDRMLAIITGFPTNSVGRGLVSLGQQLEGFSPWLDAPNTWTCRFEDVIGSQGGGCDDVQLRQIYALGEHIGISLTERLAADIARETWSTRTATFRKGGSGEWTEWFDEAMRRAFAVGVSDDLLTAYGYRHE